MRRRYIEDREKSLFRKLFHPSGTYTFTVPDGCTSIDIFLVGGGGSGGAWSNWGQSWGGSGAGGGTNTIKGVLVNPGDSLTLTVGQGGQGSSVNGSETSILMPSGTRYTAPGGNCGLHGQSGNPNNDYYNYFYTLLGKSASNGGKYDNSGIFSTEKSGSTDNISYIKNAKNEILGSFDYTVYGTGHTTGNNPYIFKIGIPEFWEDGNPLHAAGGATNQQVKPVTDFTTGKGDDRDRRYSSTDYGTSFGGGGYGGGGAGGFYGGSSGANGGDGVIILRYYAYEE